MNKEKLLCILFVTAFLLGALALSSFAQTDELQGRGHFRFPDTIIPIIDLEAYGTYSQPNSGGEVWGAIVSGSMAPVIKCSDELYIIPLYDGYFKRQKFFAHVEEGARAYDEIQHHDLSLSVKQTIAGKVTVRPSVFCGWDLNSETEDEDWGEGLYDYRELGSGLDLDYTLYKAPDGQVILTGGCEWYNRHYPNYNTLISLATVTAPEEDEKDFNAVEVSTGWKYSDLENLSVDLEYTLLMKFFTDKKIIDADGVLEDEERNEFRNSVNLDASYAPSPGRGFLYSLSSGISHNTSNQNFYDSRSTAVLTDDVFTSDYFDYFSFEVNPSVSYIFKSGEKTVVIVSGGYDLLIRQYTGRKAQLMGGVYSDADQRDYNHLLEAKAEIPIDEHISWISSYDYTISDSNTDYEEFYDYNYTMHRVLTGISLTY